MISHGRRQKGKHPNKSHHQSLFDSTTMSGETAASAVTLGSKPDVNMIDVDKGDAAIESDDNVSEYSFTSEDYPHESELEDSDEDDARSHISLSSTEEPEVFPVDGVVWDDLSPSQRICYERMFGSLPQQPLHNSWSFTEDYQAEIDHLCNNYIKVYTLDKWLIPPQEAHATRDGMVERMRKRTLGIPIFADRTIQLHPGQTLLSQPLMQAAPPGVNIGQSRHQPFPFAQQQQQQHYYQQQQQLQNGGMLMGMHQGPMRGTTYMPQVQQAMPGMPRQLMMNDPNNRSFRSVPPTMITRPPPKAPTPPYPTRTRPDFRKTVGKSAGRSGKTRRQAETDEFPWNRDLDFIKARVASKTEATWDYSAYDEATIANMKATRERNEPVVAALERDITMKQSKLLYFPPKPSVHILTQHQSNHVTRVKPRVLKRTPTPAQIMMPSVMLKLSARLMSKMMAKASYASREAGRRVVLLAKPATTHTILETSPLLQRRIRNLPLRWACIHPKC